MSTLRIKLAAELRLLRTEAESVAMAHAIECADRADQVRALLGAELARPEPRGQRDEAERRGATAHGNR